MPLPQLISTWKTISVTPGWSEPDGEDSYVRIYSPLEIDGIAEAGLVFTAGTYIHHPDRHVTFELSVLDAALRRVRLIRVDWKSLRGGHSNDRRKCAGSRGGERVPATHLHSFELNYVEADQRMKKGRLPCAEPISEDLKSFEELRDYVGT